MDNLKQLNDGNLFYLDLSSTPLYGFEREQNDLTLDALIKAIERNIVLPPVPVFEFEGNYYLSSSAKIQISFGGKYLELLDGGHHRAVAHFIAKKPLLCKLVNEELDTLKRLPIQDNVIVDDDGEYKGRKCAFKNYL